MTAGKDDQSPGSITVKQQELQSEEILKHLNQKSVTKMALCWQDRISFILHNDMKITRIKFHEFDKTETEYNSEAEKLDVELSLLAPLYSEFSQSLYKPFTQ